MITSRIFSYKKEDVNASGDAGVPGHPGLFNEPERPLKFTLDMRFRIVELMYRGELE